MTTGDACKQTLAYICSNAHDLSTIGGGMWRNWVNSMLKSAGPFAAAQLMMQRLQNLLEFLIAVTTFAPFSFHSSQPPRLQTWAAKPQFQRHS